MRPTLGVQQRVAASRYKPEKLLRLSRTRIHPQTLWRYYMVWRSGQGLEESCDTAGCPVDGPTWMGQALRLSLDHANGNPCDNRPENLRLLCPNCHAQQPTTAGRNRGRHRTTHAGWEHDRPDGLVESAVFTPVAEAVADAPSGHTASQQSTDS